MAHPDNSGSALRFVFKFCTMKGANKYMEIIFKKKTYSGKLGHFGPKMVRPYNFGSPLRYIFYFAQQKGQEVHENCISCFSRKYLIWGNLIFLGHFLLFDWASLKLSQATVAIGSLNNQGMISFMITTGSLNSQDMIWIL